jgi:hypothetical protein
MGTDAKENSLLEKPIASRWTSLASEDRDVPPENSHGESALLCLAELAEKFDTEQVAADARSVAERVSEGRFYFACIGQFKRGKSSVLNALVGDNVLPTGVVPVSAERKMDPIIARAMVICGALSGTRSNSNAPKPEPMIMRTTGGSNRLRLSPYR